MIVGYKAKVSQIDHLPFGQEGFLFFTDLENGTRV